MPRKKNEKKAVDGTTNDADEEEEEEEDDGIRTKKLAFRSILLPHVEDQMIQIFFNRSLVMTKIASLASLLLLFKINTAFDEENLEFFDKNEEQSKNVIIKCFNAVLEVNINTEMMPVAFRMDVERYCKVNGRDFEWPSKKTLGNSFNYFYDQYTTNVKTNLNTHCYTRLNYFFRIKCFEKNLRNNGRVYDHIDIRNIMKDVMWNQDWTGGDEDRQEKKNELWAELIEIGFPEDTCIKWFVKDNWFRSIWMFSKIQRVIEEFFVVHAHNINQWNEFNKDRKNNKKPTVKQPPMVHNFTVVPMCRFKLKHTRLDQHDLYNIASKLKLLPRYINPDTRRYKRISREYYRENKDELWGLIFDMNKIRKRMNNKTFHYMLLTDSVSVSDLHDVPKKKKNDDEKDKRNS